jgi:hypothetical protein
MRAETVIRGLLETFSEAQDPLKATPFPPKGKIVRGKQGSDSHLFIGAGTGEHLMRYEWHSGSYAELERALKEMRSQGKQKAIEGVPLLTLWWHVSRRYLMSERKTVEKLGKRNVETMIYWPRCICGHPFSNSQVAREHIRTIHGVSHSLERIYPSDYQRALKESRGRCEECERLGVQWLAEWFKSRGIKPRLPKAYRPARSRSATREKIAA